MISIAIVIVSGKFKESSSHKSWNINEEWKSKIKSFRVVVEVFFEVVFCDVVKEEVELNEAVEKYGKC